MVGDLPKNLYIVELKSENIFLVLGPFHQQLSFIYCIDKGFRGSSIADVLVSAGVDLLIKHSGENTIDVE